MDEEDALVRRGGMVLPVLLRREALLNEAVESARGVRSASLVNAGWMDMTMCYLDAKRVSLLGHENECSCPSGLLCLER